MEKIVFKESLIIDNKLEINSENKYLLKNYKNKQH